MDKGKKYVVYEGKQPGIYDSWEDASRQVLGHSGNVHRKVSNPAEAERSFERFQASNNGTFLFTDGTLGAFWCFSWEKCQWCLLDRAALEGQCYSAQRKTAKEEKGDRERETGKSYGESSKGMEGGVRQVSEIVMQNLQEPYREGEAQAGQNGPSYAIRRLHAYVEPC